MGNCNPDCSTTILGASKVSQLKETIKAVEIYKKLDKELHKEILGMFLKEK